MPEQIYDEKRKFLRLDHLAPLKYKICRQETISRLLDGYTSNISQAGLLCSISAEVHIDDILWLMFDRSTLEICEELDKKVLVYQNGIIGKVVRIEENEQSSFDIGVQFITRQEKNESHIYPKIYFLEKNLKEKNESS